MNDHDRIIFIDIEEFLLFISRKNHCSTSQEYAYGSNQMLIGEDGITGERGSWIESSNE